MESDQSYSADSNSSSGSSSGSSDGEEEILEPVKILGHTLELPQDLLEDYGIFKEFFSLKTWESLEDKHKDHLKNFLPKFSDNDEEEKEKTIQMLFNREPFHFTSPLNDFHNNLRQGNYRPDIAKMKKFLLKARAKQQRHKIKSYYAKLLPEVLISRERLLAVAKAAPPGALPQVPVLPPKPSSRNNYRPPHVRARQRYFEELSAIRSEVGGEESDDENYPDGPPAQPSRKRGRFSTGQQVADGNVSGTLGGNDPSSLNSLECLKNVLAAHRARRQYRENHPELNTTGITLDDIRQRVQLVNGAKKLMFGGAKSSDTPIQKLRRAPKKEKQPKLDSKQANKGKEEALNESVETRPLLPNIKIKCEQEESDSEGSSFVDPVASPRAAKRQKSPEVEIKQEVADIKYPDSGNLKFMDRNLDCVIKQEPQDPIIPMSTKLCQPVPIKLEDLDGIDMMALPIELADDGDMVAVTADGARPAGAALDADDSLTETTYANFLCLVRALFPARAAHRASKQQLRARCSAVMRSPIAPLNTWYNLSDDWCAELDSALDFLAGERGPHPEDFVPYLQFIPETQMYQWIGAGRDCDAILGRICERWLRAVSPQPPPNDLPPPRYPTSWVVRAPTNAEIAEFRAQERKRFAAAAKPFTYLQHGYRAVVGPCARAPVTCAAHGSLVADRPRHATLLALVRDAVARLPNGEGTRHDILTLLKMSQYISSSSEQVLLSAVSSSLDRLHAAKRDPVVKYDQRSAVWTYLHRNRSEEDWIVKSTSGRGGKKNAAALAASSQPGPAAPASAPAAPAEELPSPSTPDIDLEVAVEEVVENASDSDVDVDDSSDASNVPNLSSAQLLRQVTQATQVKQLIQQPPTPTRQTKAKLVPTLTAKAKTNPPQTKPPTQSPKNPVKTLTNPPVKTPQAKPSQIAKPSPTPPKPTPKAQKPPIVQSPKQPKVQQIIKQSHAAKQNLSQSKQAVPAAPQTTQLPKSSPSSVAAPLKSPLLKQRPLLKTDVPRSEPMSVPGTPKQEVVPSQTITPVPAASPVPTPTPQNKVMPGTRSLLIRPSAAQTTVTAASPIITQVAGSNPRRGVVRVLSPATQPSGKSLISPRALMTQNTATAGKKRPAVQSTPPVTTSVQATPAVTTVASSVPTVVSTAIPTRTVQLAGGRTVQLAANQTVHLPSGQAVQLSSGHTLQLSSLQLQPTHSVRLPSGQTVQLASQQTVRAVTTAQMKNQSIRPPMIVKNPSQVSQTQSPVQIPVSTVQLAGQTVQIGGQSVQLTGHTVKLPSGQSVQVASQSVQMQTQSVQLPSGQTVQLASGQNIPLQAVQLAGQNVLASGPSVQMPSGQSVQLGSQTVQLGGQTVQLGGQTVQLAGGQTVQLPSGQTLQLSSGQTVQLSSGQTLQLSGQTVQLANQAQKTVTQHVRTQMPVDKTGQPIVAKLLTNAQGQMISLEGMVGGARALQLASPRARGVPAAPAAARLARPLILAAAGKPLHNIVLQQSDGTAIRVTSSGGTTSSQAIVISNIGGQTASTTTTSAPVLKLQQVNALQQLKLHQGIKIQQTAGGATTATVPTSSGGIRSVLMDGQQLKLVSGRHVLARLLRPSNPPQ